MRDFMFLQATRRAGIDPTSAPPPRSLAMLCLACPHSNINMAPNWNKLPWAASYVLGCHAHSSNLAHLIDRFPHWMHKTSDGNFHATEKNKPLDDSDFPMTLGGAYFPDECDYKEVSSQMPRYPSPLLKLL